MLKRICAKLPLLTLAAASSCAQLAPAAVPVAMDAGRELTKVFAEYIKSKLGYTVTQVNCEVEDHPEDEDHPDGDHPEAGEVLVLCTGKYAGK